MLLAQVLIVAFVVTLVLRALPFARPASPTQDAAAAPIAGTASLWSVKLDRQRLPVIIGIVAGLLALIPNASEMSLAMALRGLWGDPSITSVQLLALAIGGRTPAAFSQGWRGPAAIALVAALFYPLAMGATDFDPYRLGYAPVLLVLPLALAALWLWHRGQALWLWLLAIDLLAWAAGLLESPNLWDTLLDPLLACACIVLAVRNGWRSFRKAP